MNTVAVDSDVVVAAEHYVQFGLNPGGCCMQILLGSLEGAAKRCHPLAAFCLPATYDAVRAVVPVEARDSVEAINKWIAHQGLSGKPSGSRQDSLEVTTRLARMLEDLRAMRDESHAFNRSDFNQACDRLDVLLSKLYCQQIDIP